MILITITGDLVNTNFVREYAVCPDEDGIDIYHLHAIYGYKVDGTLDSRVIYSNPDSQVCRIVLQKILNEVYASEYHVDIKQLTD